MRFVVLVVIGCGGSSPRQEAPIPVAPAASDGGAVATPAMPPADPADAVPAQPAPPPPPEDLIAKLPKQDFAPAFRETTDAAATKKAMALNAAGVAFHAKKDHANAETKYREALEADPGHVLARYNLACVYNLTGKSDRGLALLAELAKAACATCSDSIARARYDDDWRSQWDQEVFWQLALGSTPSLPDKCPAGTRKRLTGKLDWDHTAWCEKGGVKHGPYREAAFHVHCAGACEGARHIQGMYENGRRVGIWSHSESYGPEWSGAFDDAGEKHGLWTDGDHKAQETVVYVHGVAEGRTREEYENHPKFEGSYKGGKRHGLATTYEDYGKLFVASRGDYVDGDQHGRWTTWNESGQAEADGSYHHGKKVGRWRTFVAGEVSVIENYDAGKLHGERVEYASGKRVAVGHYDRGQRHGEFSYWPGGKQVTTTMDHDSGDWIEYAGDQLVAKGKLIKGARDGAWIYTDDEHYSAEGSFAAGKRTGPWTMSKDGKKVLAGTYTDGKRTGEWTRWHDTGKEKARGPFVADKRHGAWTYWNDTGVLIARGNYAAGQRTGKWELLDAEGEVVQTLVFKADKLVTVDGKRTTKRWEAGAESVEWEEAPAPIEEREPFPGQ